METLLASAPIAQSPQLDPDAPFKETLVAPVVPASTRIEPQNNKETELLPGAPGSPMPRTDSIPAKKDQTGTVKPTTQSRRASPFGLFAVFGGVGFFVILGIGVIILIVLPGMLRKPVTPVLTSTPAQVLPIVLPTSTPSQTPEPELGFTLVEPQDALKMYPDLKTLSDLADEKYSDVSWNKLNVLLTFTINSKPDVPIVWYWGWCAVNGEILQQNMTQIHVIFNADGYEIPKDRLAVQPVETSTDPKYKGWKCQGYVTILQDWKPGTYTLKETINFSSSINDGKDTFEVGSMFREYTVNISP
jgi:hypothetical protein